MKEEIRNMLESLGYDVDGMLECGLYSNFRMEKTGNVLFEVCANDNQGYTQEVRPDGASRHCGYGRGCFWTDWEQFEEGKQK